MADSCFSTALSIGSSADRALPGEAALMGTTGGWEPSKVSGILIVLFALFDRSLASSLASTHSFSVER